MSNRNRGLLVIASFKWLSAILLCALALGIIKLGHRDPADVLEDFIRSFNIDPDGPLLGWMFDKLSLIDQQKLMAVSVASFGYSGLLLVQGTGLYFEQRWAEYLTIVATASFLPFELYELAKKIDAPKIVLLAINIAILVFLVILVRKPANSASRRRT